MADWQKYELILFNIIQNSVKFNVVGGQIVINIMCYQQINEDNTQFILETEVIDTGIGI